LYSSDPRHPFQGSLVEHSRIPERIAGNGTTMFLEVFGFLLSSLIGAVAIIYKLTGDIAPTGKEITKLIHLQGSTFFFLFSFQ